MEPAGGEGEFITARSGYELLMDPLLNKGTAFTQDEALYASLR